MLDIQFIRDHPGKVKQAAKNKQLNPDVFDRVLRLDKQRRDLIKQIEQLRAERNQLGQDDIDRGRAIKKQLQDIEPQLKKIKAAFKELMLQVPNIPAADVPVGQDESANKQIRTWGKKPHFDFPVKDHVELGEKLDLIDLKRGVKIGGFRSFYLKNDLVLMELGLLNYTLNQLVKKGFKPLAVPWLVKDMALWGTGFFPWGIDDHYTTQDKTKLIGTAEVSLTAYHADEILKQADLPVKLVGISPCFRREVGSYGKDTHGLFRVHQFNKVEQIILCRSDKQESINWHEALLKNAEAILQALKLPYRVMLMSTGDMGAAQVKKYDLETWFPAQKQYRETHSDSYFFDFQARRLNIRYRNQQGKTKFVHTLNNTAIATPRILAAIIENYQQPDGSIKVPDILQSYVGKKVINPLD